MDILVRQYQPQSTASLQTTYLIEEALLRLDTGPIP